MKMKSPFFHTFIPILLWSLLTAGVFSTSKSETTYTKENANIEIDTSSTWSQKLGFPSDKRVIIFHADDIGMCPEANVSARAYMESDHIQSCAVMMPCPDAQDFIEWAIDHPTKDIGLHLTLTSEWKTYRWSGLTSADEAPGLLDEEGKLWHSVIQVVQNAKPEEVEKEIRAQVEQAIAWGYRPDHIDTHMGALYGSPLFTRAYLEVAEEYQIPAMVIDMSKPEVLEGFRQQGYPLSDEMLSIIDDYSLPKLDYFFSVPKGGTYDEKVENLKALIRTIPPGLTEIIFHPSELSDNLKSITNSWQQRSWEAQMFADPELIKFFEEQDLVFTNWKEIMVRHNERK